MTSQFPATRPSWRADFAGSRTVQPQFTVTRSGVASYFDSTGTARSVGANVPRINHDPVTGECLGLLIEGASANILLNSETLATQSVSVSAVTYTLSFFGTGSINLSGGFSGTIVGTGGKYRRVFTFTPSAGSLTLTVTGSVSNAQLEIGSFATSWIPTAGASASRGEDRISLISSAFSSWFRQDKGTFVIDVNQYATPNATQYIINVTDSGTLVNFYGVRIANNGDMNAVANLAGTPECYIPIGNAKLNQINRIVFAYRENDFAAASNWSEMTEDTVGSLPTVDRMIIGNTPAYQQPWYGHIKLMLYWPTRVSDSEAIALAGFR